MQTLTDRGLPGGKDQLVLVKYAQYNICVANINCQYHFQFLHLLPLTSLQGCGAFSGKSYRQFQPLSNKTFPVCCPAIHITATENPGICDIITTEPLLYLFFEACSGASEQPPFAAVRLTRQCERDSEPSVPAVGKFQENMCSRE